MAGVRDSKMGVCRRGRRRGATPLSRGMSLLKVTLIKYWRRLFKKGKLRNTMN
jgi:hypothetical protein